MLDEMGRRRLRDRVWAIVPWVLASLGALLLSRELAPTPRDSAVSPPAQAAPKPEHKDEVVYEPWERVST